MNIIGGPFAMVYVSSYTRNSYYIPWLDKNGRNDEKKTLKEMVSRYPSEATLPHLSQLEGRGRGQLRQ